MFLASPSSGEENMPRIGRKVIIAGATALALIAGASAATAAVVSSGPVDSSGVIHGCYSSVPTVGGSHVFVMQDAGTSCPRGTTAISWNEQGPAGPAGPAGATGPAGPAGATGIDGGTVVLNYNNTSGTGTCTVLNSFGPDAVSVSFVSLIGFDLYPQIPVCMLSGLPANADVQATSVITSDGPSQPGTTVMLYPGSGGATDAGFTLGTTIEPGGEFNWIAVPSS
jgi:hypothetical protein